jgi:hypothetical protein
LAGRDPYLGSFVPDFLQLIASEHIADLKSRVWARIAYALVEAADVSYSSKGLLIQLPGIRQGFEFYATNLATHQLMIRK